MVFGFSHPHWTRFLGGAWGPTGAHGGRVGVHILPQPAEPATADKTESPISSRSTPARLFLAHVCSFFHFPRQSEDSKKRGAMMPCWGSRHCCACCGQDSRDGPAPAAVKHLGVFDSLCEAGSRGRPLFRNCAPSSPLFGVCFRRSLNKGTANGCCLSASLMPVSTNGDQQRLRPAMISAIGAAPERPQ